ncbi:MAG: hypothetical protein U1U88_001048 [Lawsonella clevelandensis]
MSDVSGDKDDEQPGDPGEAGDVDVAELDDADDGPDEDGDSEEADDAAQDDGSGQKCRIRVRLQREAWCSWWFFPDWWCCHYVERTSVWKCSIHFGDGVLSICSCTEHTPLCYYY